MLIIFLPNEEVDWSIVQIVFVFLAPVVTVAFFAPFVLPLFALIKNVGELTRRDLLSDKHSQDEARQRHHEHQQRNH